MKFYKVDAEGYWWVAKPSCGTYAGRGGAIFSAMNSSETQNAKPKKILGNASLISYLQ